MPPHAAWSVLFNDPDFWSLLSKDHLAMLSSTCRSFRSDIPQRVAITTVFKDLPIKKVALFRLLPLSVNDVLGMRSPVDFLKAFLIAEAKSGGFDRLISIVREKGWQLWVDVGENRARRRAAFEAELTRLGVVELPTGDPIYRAALVTQQRAMSRVAFWQYSTTDRELLPFSIFNPYTAEVDLARRLACSRSTFRRVEYDTVLQLLRMTFSQFYKGINADCRTALGVIRAARDGGKDRCTVVLLSHGCLLVGAVRIDPWPRPPQTLAAID